MFFLEKNLNCFKTGKSGKSGKFSLECVSNDVISLNVFSTLIVNSLAETNRFFLIWKNSKKNMKSIN